MGGLKAVEGRVQTGHVAAVPTTHTAAIRNVSLTTGSTVCTFITPTAGPTPAPTFVGGGSAASVSSTVAAMSSQIVSLQSQVSSLTSTNVAQSSLIASISAAASAANHGALIGQVSTQVSTLTSSIVAAVSTLPATVGSSFTGHSPSITSDHNTLNIRSEGRQITFQANCATIDPCDVLSALNDLKNL
eukprot:m.307773 g.307773  ORF g.307773 m.307773 type:complete len:188 (+) comp16368_c0_seq2:331-894(+)